MIEIILIFLYIGLFTIGGGLVAIPLIQQQVVERGLITLDEFVSMIAIAEATPGPIGVNIATYVGYSQYGVIGAVLATFSFILPSFIIVTLLHGLLKKYRESLLVVNWFVYLKSAIVGLILYAAMNIFTHAVVLQKEPSLVIEYKEIIILVLLIPIYYFTKNKPWIIILAGAVLGMLMYSFF